MNKKRRDELNQISTMLEMIKEKIQDVLTDEEWAFDGMPENLQGSERGERSVEAQGSLSEAMDKIDEVVEFLSDAINC